MSLLNGKVVIVTGAGRGIGRAIALAMAASGAAVVVNDVGTSSQGEGADQTPAQSVVNEIAATGGRAVANYDSVADWDAAHSIVATAIKNFGRIDGVVNNAGIFITKPFLNYTVDDFERLSEVNLKGYIYITQLAVKQMLAQKTRGSVICITSAMVRHPIAQVNASVAMITKGGLEAITLSLAMEYAKDGIRFNAIAPGEVNTPMHAKDSRDYLRSLSPMGAIAEISDIVEAILYLTEARYVTGEVLHVDAGAHNGKW